jgi:4-diphosphocytidyl-2-C-methyl-D-erythritol kinase
VPAARVEQAPAKVNLTLRVLGRRADGYHEIESLVVFAGVGDTLSFTPAGELSLQVRGPTADAAGELSDNLVVKAARSLAERVGDAKLGRFVLDKRLPVAAGLGGGSSDAAAALRLLAHANRLALDDARVMAAARTCGADVPVCLEPRPRVMRGIGEILSAPVDVPRLPAVLVNPRVAVPTKSVFAALHPPFSSPVAFPFPPSGETGSGAKEGERAHLIAWLAGDRNDLEAAAIAIAPAIADVLALLRTFPGCRLARMSGSGATCFGLFDSLRAAEIAARTLRSTRSAWWVRPTTFGG